VINIAVHVMPVPKESIVTLNQIHLDLDIIIFNGNNHTLNWKELAVSNKALGMSQFIFAIH